MYLDSYSVYLHLFTVHKLQTYSLPKMCRFLPTYNFYSKDFWYKFKTGKIILCSTWVKLDYQMAKKFEWTTIQDPQPPQKCKVYDNLKTKTLAKGLSLGASLISWKCKIASRFNCWSVFDFFVHTWYNNGKFTFERVETLFVPGSGASWSLNWPRFAHWSQCTPHTRYNSRSFYSYRITEMSRFYHCLIACIKHFQSGYCLVFDQ